jgi:hypothetical protein
MPQLCPDRLATLYFFRPLQRLLQRIGWDTHLDVSQHFAGPRTARRRGVPLHLQKAYERLGTGRETFPSLKKSHGEIVSLPMFTQLMPEQQNCLVQTLQDFCSPLTLAGVARG